VGKGERKERLVTKQQMTTHNGNHEHERRKEDGLKGRKNSNRQTNPFLGTPKEEFFRVEGIRIGPRKGVNSICASSQSNITK